VIEIIIETLIDGIKLVPFLFLAFLFIELLEHKFSKHTGEIVKKSGKFGPVIGSILGAVPQCGFSVMATNLYVTRIITLGTLISIYLSTSDEMLPIMISHRESIVTILEIILIKVVIGIIFGFLIDFIFRSKVDEIEDYEICEHDHCHCERGIIKSSIKHTVSIFVFILVIEFVLNIVMEYGGRDILVSVFRDNNMLGVIFSSLIGMIPNCGASVIITELYLEGVIKLSSTIAGLLTGSGVAVLVLFKSNNDIKDSLKIFSMVYVIGVISGLIIELIEYIF
jgi:hypothetical protein